MPDRETRCDVAIVGSEPAGCAAALSLRDCQPTPSVSIFDDASHSEPRAGETLQPDIRRFLEPIGAWQAFLDDQHDAAGHGAVAWGNDELQINEFINSTEQQGWRVDRDRFDERLRLETRTRGAEHHVSTRLDRAERTETGWLLEFKERGGTRLRAAARFVIDATGRAARFASLLGVRKIGFDSLMAISAICDQTHRNDADHLVEATEKGWWRSIALASDRRAVSFLTDLEMAKEIDPSDRELFQNLLQQTRHIAKSLSPSPLTEAPIVRSATTQRLDEFVGSNWLAVGDAAVSRDPLSSDGIDRALTTGRKAAHAIVDHFAGNTGALAKYRATLTAEFESYLDQRRANYQKETRWPDAPFWKPRQSLLTLPAAAVLRALPEFNSIARTVLLDRPKLLRPKQWKTLLSLAVDPTPAQELGRRYAATSSEPLADWRITEALQYLLANGALEIDLAHS